MNLHKTQNTKMEKCKSSQKCHPVNLWLILRNTNDNISHGELLIKTDILERLVYCTLLCLRTQMWFLEACMAACSLSHYTAAN